MLVEGLAVFATAWIFHTAPLAEIPATGREVAADVHELVVPSGGSCGWWETSSPVRPGGGVRFRAQVEISLENKDDQIYNDVMMFVRWDFPKDGRDRSKSGNGVDRGKFYQRDVVVYRDRIENGRIIRTFDETFSVPGECDSVEIGEVGIFVVNGDAYIKELVDRCLISHNENYKPIKLRSDDSVYCCGRVIGVVEQ